jgi:hypothetical protein
MTNFNGLPENKNLSADQIEIEEQRIAYQKEANSLWEAGWRGSKENPNSPIMSGSPELEKSAIDLETNLPLPDGAKQTAIHVLNFPVNWGDRGWFVKDGIQPAPGPDYKVITREAKDGKWINIENK